MTAHIPVTRKATDVGRRNAALILQRQLRSFFSVAAVLRASSSPSPPRQTQTPSTPDANKSRRPQTPEEQKLYDEVNERFLKQLGSSESAEKVWEDYSRLVEGTIEKFNYSILSHHMLLKMLEGTPAPPTLNAKAGVVTNLVKGLGKYARPEEYYQLARLHEQRNDLPKLQSLINEMRRNNITVTPDIFNCLIRLHLHRNDISSASWAFNLMRRSASATNTPLHPTTYFTLIRAHLARNNIKAADNLLTQLHSDGLHLDVPGYTSLMIQYARVGSFESALKIYEHLIAENFKPTFETYRALVMVYCRSGDLDKATKLIDDMESGLLEGVTKPDAYTYKFALRAYLSQDDFQNSHHYYIKMRKSMLPKDETLLPPRKPLLDETIFYPLLALSLDTSHLPQTYQIYYDMRKFKIHPSQEMFNTLIIAFATSEMTEAMTLVYADAKKHGVWMEIETTGALIEHALRRGDLDGAVDYAVDVG
ncbi:hypothetical protein HK097_000081, partial [Rhizophlyctis rosea]